MAEPGRDESIPKPESPQTSSEPRTESESSSTNGSTQLTANTSNTSGISTKEDKSDSNVKAGASGDLEASSGEKSQAKSTVRFDGVGNAPDDEDSDVDNLSDPDEPLPSSAQMDMYSLLPKPLPKTLGERIAKAPKQVKQIVQYTRLMEERVQALEDEVRTLKGPLPETAGDTNFDQKPFMDDYPKPGGFETSGPLISENKEPPISLESYKYIPGICRMSEPEYRKPHQAEDEQPHVIDVMISENNEGPPLQSASQDAEKASDNPTIDISIARGRPQSVIEPSITSHTTAAKKCSKPKRIRINSRRLLTELTSVTDQINDPTLTQFLAPFQLFTIYEHKLRDHEKVLEAQCCGEFGESELVKESKNGITERPLGTAGDRKENDEETPDSEQSRPNQVADTETTETATKAPAEPPKDEDEQGDIDELDEHGAQIPGLFIFEVMESCQTSRKEAVKALKEHRYPDYAIIAIQGRMTSEEKREADIGLAKLLLSEWKALISFLDEDLKSTLEMCAQMRAGTLKEIAYDDLSHLYKPGDTVISTQNRRLQAYTVIATSGGRELLSDSISTDPAAVPGEGSKIDPPVRTIKRYSPFTVDCWYYDFGGTGFECIPKSIIIPKFDDLKAVTSLAVYPEALHNDRSRDLIAELKARGKKFLELCSEADIGHRQYLGRTLDETPEEVDSQVIVDCRMAATVLPDQRPDKAEWVPQGGAMITTEPDEREIVETNNSKDGAAFKCSPSCTICASVPPAKIFFNDQKFNRQKSKEYLNSWAYADRTVSVNEFEEDGLVLLPPRVFGFVLRSRKWARLDVDRISRVTTEKNGFKKLVLKEGYAEIVQALVETHFKDPPPESEKVKLRHDVDLVRGKGKGLIILLHGAPGVGKTSTAESVAEFTGKPLYPITCGDIGETAKEVEENLDRCFRQAHKWGCVLLLDEADVFLAKRDKADLKRNALVSVFLRVLEYYAGILFLTTNRVGAFDDAFKSRIHMSLYYPDLDKDSTLQVWKMNLERTRENMPELDIKTDDILKFARKHFEKKAAEKKRTGSWNGRQIRNAFQTAIALADWHAKQESIKTGKTKIPKLTAKRFKQVAEASAEFDEYLLAAHGESENKRAQTAKERVEDWDIDEPEPRPRPSRHSSRRKERIEVKEPEKPSKVKNKKHSEPDGGNKKRSEPDDRNRKREEADGQSSENSDSGSDTDPNSKSESESD